MRYNRYTLDDLKKSSDRKRFSYISFFAGGGGSSAGYKLAGGDHQLEGQAQKLAFLEMLPGQIAAHVTMHMELDAYDTYDNLVRFTHKYVKVLQGLAAHFISSKRMLVGGNLRQMRRKEKKRRIKKRCRRSTWKGCTVATGPGVGLYEV